MVASNDAKMSVTVADALQESHETGPIAAQCHGVSMFAIDQAIAFRQTIKGLWVVGFKRHFA